MNKKTNNNLIFIETVDSTNSAAKKRLKESLPEEGTVIMAGFQTNGKGQAGNLWESEKDKNLLASIIWYPKSIRPDQQFYLSMVVSSAICDLLKTYGLSPQIKWPNDIFVDNKKIAGILIELGIMGDSIINVITGIGLNVNQRVFNDYQPLATSLVLESGEEHKVYELSDKLSEFLSVHYSELKRGGLQKLKQPYLELLFRFEEWAMYNDGKNDFQAMILDVAESGELILQNKDGQCLKYAFKEISFIGI